MTRNTRLHPTRKPARRRTPRRPRFFLPALEGLETRTLPAGTWTALANLAPSPTGIGTMMLLSDGTVMAQGGNIDRTWYKLAPDSSGSYVAGTWSSRASMSV